MKLLKQTKLYFQEGNANKVYEVDLCEVRNGLYVVNFRFGKRDGVLKEGTKTLSPLSFASAEQVFDALVAEKRRNGYLLEGETAEPRPEAPKFAKLDINLEGADAILTRLKGFVEGKKYYKSEWKAARVIWRAGELKIKEAAPFILRLLDTGDEMQTYSALWALARIGETNAEQTFFHYFTQNRQGEHIKRIAGMGLLSVLAGQAREQHLEYYQQRLPEFIRKELAQLELLGKVLRERFLASTPDDCNFFVDVYILSLENPALKKEVLAILREIPLKAGFFRAVRHILKIAELRDDFETLGLLSYRFERVQEMFVIPRDMTNKDAEREYSRYVPELGQSVRIRAELKKKNARLAYSNRTRSYLLRRTMRELRFLGQNNKDEYVKLALSILLSYNSQSDYKAAYPGEERYRYYGSYSSWDYTRKNHPEYADAIFLNQILYGAGKRLKFNGKVWEYTEVEVTRSSRNRTNNAQGSRNPQKEKNQNTSIINRIFSSIQGLFSKSEREEVIQPIGNFHSPNVAPRQEEKIQIEREELFPHLWDKFPQAYIQLLLKARVDAIHEFAIKNLSQHAAYQQLKQKIDFPLIEQFLASDYRVPALFGLTLVKEKLVESPNRSLTLALLNSRLAEARKLGMEFIEKDLDTYFEESLFIKNLLFSPFEEVRKWGQKILGQRKISEVQQQLIMARSLAHLAQISENSEENNAIIKDATEILFKNCGEALNTINHTLIVDLLSSPVQATQVFAVRIIILKNIQPSAEVFCSLLASPFERVRKVGAELLTELMPRIHQDPQYAATLVKFLLPLLMRKEPYEGLHEDISALLSHQLVAHLSSVDITTSLRLMHSNYRPAQDFAWVLLQKYVDAKSMTMRQIVDLANHELLVFRQWCWNYFEANLGRIQFEREEAIRLLDSKWDDSRAFAIRFFREKFTENDWSPEILISIADSVRPEIETFGRELISRFFEEGQGEEYLLKLSQHPSVGVQLFATNYLESFAADDSQKMRQLDFYFRSVLTRVNKGRSSKARVFAFLHQEALKSEESALLVADILRDVSATVAIEDKATCIRIMRDLQANFADLQLPIKVLDFEVR